MWGHVEMSSHVSDSTAPDVLQMISMPPEGMGWERWLGEQEGEWVVFCPQAQRLAI
jgi:hypothetical protein